MKVEIIQSCCGPFVEYKKGQILELDDKKAKSLIRTDIARAIDVKPKKIPKLMSPKKIATKPRKPRKTKK